MRGVERDWFTGQLGLALALAASGCAQDSYADGLTPQWTFVSDRSAEGMSVSGAGDVVLRGAQWVEQPDVTLPWMTRVSVTGEERWTRWYSAANELLEVIVTSRGELYVASEPEWSQSQSTCSALARLHANGAPTWARDYGSPGEGCFRGLLDMVELAGGGVEVIDYYGSWLRYDGDGTPTQRVPAELVMPGLYEHYAVLRGDGSRVVAMSGAIPESAVVFLSPEGEVIQTVRTVGSMIRAIAGRSDGGVVLAGAVELPGEGLPRQDRWIGSIDAAGALQWEQRFPGEGDVRFSEITDVAIAPGDYAIAVGSERTSDTDLILGEGWIGVLGPGGALAWETSPTRVSAYDGAPASVRPRWVDVDDDGAVYIGGDGGGHGFWVSRYQVGI